MISPLESDDKLTDLFNRTPRPVPDSTNIEVLFGGAPRFTEGQRVRLLVDMEELKAGMIGTVRRADGDRNFSNTDGVEFDDGDGISIRRYVAGRIERVIDHVEPVEDHPQDMDADLERLIAEIEANAPTPVPELSLTMQAVSGFLTGLTWAIEDRTPWEKLSDDQQRIITLVREIVERDDPTLAKDAE